MARRSIRSTAGQLPERYRQDLSLSPQSAFENQAGTSISPEMAPARSDISSEPPLRLADRPRGRQRTRSRPNMAVTDSHPESGTESIIYPRAAFPTKDFPFTKATSDEGGGGSKRDSMDLKVPPKPKSTHKSGHSSKANIQALFLDGTYMDLAGNNMHFLDKHYDAHEAEYEANLKASQGSTQDRNAAFRAFLNTPEYEDISQHRSKEAVMEAFEKWLARDVSKLEINKDKSDAKGLNQVSDFDDEKFAKLHFKLQWHIIQEVEEDLAHHPPQCQPLAAGWKSFRFARDIFGIKSTLVVRALEKKMEKAKNKQELMPQEEDFAQAKEYLQARGLALSLIEMYDYLDTTKG